MKDRFLNLNHFAGKFLALVAIFLMGIPLLGWLLQALGIRLSILAWIVRTSVWTGVALLLVFLLLIGVEQVLDARLYRRYRQTLSRPIPLLDGLAECPNCGYRQVRSFDRACPSCGKPLIQ